MKPRTVLLVEDEALVRMELADMLGDLGLVVLEANDADEAIEILDQRPDIELMMTDVNMPGSMDGIRLAHHVRDRWPPIKLLVVSGNSDIQFPTLPDEAIFLPKPFNDQRLKGALSNLIG